MESKSSEDTSSAANSEEYEIVKKSEAATAEMSAAKMGDSCDEAALKECLQDTSIHNENIAIEDHTIFHNISYLGATRMDEPKNERLIQGIIKQFNVLDDLQKEEEERSSVNVILAVPKSSEDQVILRDAESKSILTQFEICRIIFFARGNSGTPDASCFAFTCAHSNGDQGEKSNYFQCHVFRCVVGEAVTKVFVSFAQAFRKKEERQSLNSGSHECFLFEVTLELKEKSAESSNYDLVPRQKGVFKLRSNVEKKVVVSVQQISQNSCKLAVERCFGMLVSPGRNVRHADMQLLEHVTMATTCQGKITIFF